MQKLGFNQTFEENQRLNLGWKPTVFVYLVYVLIMSLVRPIVSHQVFGLSELFSLLCAYTVSAVVCLYLILKFGRTPVSLGLAQEGFLRKWLAGWGYAFFSLGLVFLVNYSLNGLNFGYNSHFSLLIFLLLLIGFAIQSFMEEFLLRSLIQVLITMKFGVLAGVLGSSVFFAIGHAGNSNASIISVINTFLFAVAFGLLFCYHDNLWIVAGFHAGWNFILGPVLGIAVSGFELPTSLIKTSLHLGKSYLNGGRYGFEASYLVTIIFLIIIAIYAVLLKKQPRQREVDKL
ncbi:lysostaphin resistance A-like protein [Streptococcus sp. H49]|uniref:CPBP family intramembrane glutamic endopeptidase n=1 Tax=Streptococcus huangxiaojuni TaxID=3237239 RepID=UPI0034A25D75